MKNNKIILCIALACLTALFIFGFAYAQDDVMILKHDIFSGSERPAVVFPHALHADKAGIDCMECHHIYKDGKNVWDDSEESDCTVCHGLKADGKKLSAMRAFHANCKGCHTDEGKGPLTCGECHPRKK